MEDLPTDFDLNLLRVLIALYRSRSVSRAAEALHLSQPATSLALGRLRKAFDDPLFVRSKSVMLPTSRCIELAEAASKVMTELSEHLNKKPTFDPSVSQRDFVIAATDVAELYFLPRLIVHLHQTAPRCNLRCRSLPVNEVATALEDGRCDLALGVFTYLQRSTLRSRPLSAQTLVCLVRADHPDVSSAQLSMEQFQALSHLVVRPSGFSQELLESLLAARGLTRRVQLVTEHFMAVPSIIAATDMIVTVPQSVADFYAPMGNLRIVEAPMNIADFPISVFWHQRFHGDPAVRWLRESIVRLFETSPP